jgi:hypothetical protein
MVSIDALYELARELEKREVREAVSTEGLTLGPNLKR